MTVVMTNHTMAVFFSSTIPLRLRRFQFPTKISSHRPRRIKFKIQQIYKFPRSRRGVETSGNDKACRAEEIANSFRRLVYLARVNRQRWQRIQQQSRG